MNNETKHHKHHLIVVKTEDIRNLRLFDALVLAYIRQDAGDTKQTKVTNTELSNALGASLRYVSLAVSRLRKAGLIEQVDYNGVYRTLKMNE